jgi:hypothetical protein
MEAMNEKGSSRAPSTSSSVSLIPFGRTQKQSKKTTLDHTPIEMIDVGIEAMNKTGSRRISLTVLLPPLFPSGEPKNNKKKPSSTHTSATHVSYHTLTN